MEGDEAVTGKKERMEDGSKPRAPRGSLVQKPKRPSGAAKGAAKYDRIAAQRHPGNHRPQRQRALELKPPTLPAD
jgi:hypothetical protein